MKKIVFFLYFFSAATISFSMQEKIDITQEIFVICNPKNPSQYSLLTDSGELKTIEKLDVPELSYAQICTPHKSKNHYIQVSKYNSEECTSFDSNNINNTYVVNAFSQNQVSWITTLLDRTNDYSVIVKLTTTSGTSKTQHYFRIKQIVSDYPVVFSTLTTALGVVGIVGITVTCIAIWIAKRYLFSRG